MKVLKKNREKYLPEICDFSKDYPEFKWMNPKKMSLNQYLWMSGYNYLIVYYGLKIVPAIIFSSIGLYFHSKSSFILMGVFYLFAIYFIIKSLIALKQYKLIKGRTFYNMMLMDSIDEHGNYLNIKEL